VNRQIALLSSFFIRLNQLNTSTQGKYIIFLDVLADIVALQNKIKLNIHRMESGKIAAFLILKASPEEVEINLRCIRQIFLERLNTFLSELIRYPFSQLHQISVRSRF